MKGFYYLHVNGDLIYKPDYEGVVGDFRDSDLVRAFWPFNSEYREDAWNLLVEALCLGKDNERTIQRVKELAEKWGCNDEDAKHYCNLLGLEAVRDGNAWCVNKSDFINQVESPCGYGDTILEALAELCHELGFQYTKLNWHADFKMMCKVAQINTVATEDTK